ncbi:MAG: hypothetical protein K6D96_03330 [Acetatifactor sp.]|nr:hypothetical protein [Acetatifactor sp.]
MKKTLIKAFVFVAVFIITVLVASKIMNKDHDSITVDMEGATFPVINIMSGDIVYNRLFGYSDKMNEAFMRDTVSVLDENRKIDFRVQTFGRAINNITVEVRTNDGSRLIEKTDVTDLTVEKDEIRAGITLKDLIDKDTEYSLGIILSTDVDQDIYYYTRIIWGDNYRFAEDYEFVKDFHDRLFDKELAVEITKYLETNSRIEDNSSFHKVNIHSSFSQVTYGNLEPFEVSTPAVNLTFIGRETATFLVDYRVATIENKTYTYYKVREYFRVKYTSSRMYLLDYERTMTQIPNAKTMCANDKIALGIADENVPMAESEDGTIVVFEAAGQLFEYNSVTNRVAAIFSFYDSENNDDRAYNDGHCIEILRVDEVGNVYYAVSGYMNRGRYEGKVGVQVYEYDASLNTNEELIYINYDKSPAVLKSEISKLLYMNSKGELYLILDNSLYKVDLNEKNYEVLLTTKDDGIYVSEDDSVVVWQEGDDIYDSNVIHINNFGLNNDSTVRVPIDEAILPLGFMGLDVIYGVAKKEDIKVDGSGNVFFPMYRVAICDFNGETLKNYYQENMYVLSAFVEGNQITLKRQFKNENGFYSEAMDDQIMNNADEEPTKNVIASADIEKYERFVQIKTKSQIDTKSLQILTPKEVLYEGQRRLTFENENKIDRFYVYGHDGVSGIYVNPAKAVMQAYDEAGIVSDEKGNCIWIKGNRVNKNQIMAIKEAKVEEGTTSAGVCLDTVLAFEGVSTNSQYYLDRGKSIRDVLEDYLDVEVLNLTGCPMESVLYYVNRDLPVFAILDNGDCVLITGFNEYNVVIMQPSNGSLYKKGMNDSASWFAENGNRFITYVRND